MVIRIKAKPARSVMSTKWSFLIEASIWIRATHERHET